MRAKWWGLVAVTLVSSRLYAPPAVPLLVVPETLAGYQGSNVDFHGANFFWGAESVAATIAPVIVPGSPLRALAQEETWNVNRVAFLTEPDIAAAFRSAWETYRAYRAGLTPEEQSTVDRLVVFAISRSPADGDTDAKLRVPVGKHSPLVLNPVTAQRYVIAEVRFTSNRDRNPHRPGLPLTTTVFNYHDPKAHGGQAYALLYRAQNATDYERAHLDFSADAVTLSVTINYYNNPSVIDPFQLPLPFVGVRDGKAVYEVVEHRNKYGGWLRAMVTVAPDGTTEVFTYEWERPSLGRLVTLHGGRWKQRFHFSGKPAGLALAVAGAPAECGPKITGDRPPVP